MTNTIPNVPRELLDSLLTVIESNGYAADEVEVVDELRALLSAPSPTGVDADHVEDVRAMVAAPSPAGVDGLEVVAYADSGGALYTTKLLEIMAVDSVGCEPLCRLSDAQAIIDGLRGGVAELRKRAKTAEREAGSALRTYKGLEKVARVVSDNSDQVCGELNVLRQQFDQQARRIGELEAALEFACKSLAQVTSSDGSGHADIAVSVLRMAGRKEVDASQIVEVYKASARWRIDAALSAGKDSDR